MLHEFLTQNSSKLIERCRAKVAKRISPRPSVREMQHGIPLFLDQLITTLRIAQHAAAPSGALSPPVPAPVPAPGLAGRHVSSELENSASRHGMELLQRGFSVDQVVHNYGDLCQAVTELAIEENAAVEPGEFRILNLCLDNAIAAAVTEYDRQRNDLIWESGNRAMSERLGFLAHELRNSLNTAMLAFAAIKRGGVGLDGATAGVLDRSHVALRDLIDRALADVRLGAGAVAKLDLFAVDEFIAQAEVSGNLEARVKGCRLHVEAVEEGLMVLGDRQMLASALSNLLQNAFKFTHRGSEVRLVAYAKDGRIRINVQDECGGLPAGKADAMFQAFTQHHADRSGLGLGLSITRRAVEASGGLLSVRDMPGIGCVFTIDLPRHVTEGPATATG